MKRVLGLWCVLFASAHLTASGSGLLQQISGKYSILLVNGAASPAGWFTVVANDTSLGYQASPIPMASISVPVVSVLTPTDQTRVSQYGSVLHQEYAAADSSVVIDYIREDGYLVVSASVCSQEEAVCARSFVVASSGGSPGGEVDARHFFQGRIGSYRLSLAGGHEPKPENRVGQVFDYETEGLVMFTYCPPDGSFCDPGFFFFDYEKTKIYQRKISNDLTVYDIFLGSGSQTTYFSWIERKGKILFRNLQYKLYEEFVCLEHEAQFESEGE